MNEKGRPFEPAPSADRFQLAAETVRKLVLSTSIIVLVAGLLSFQSWDSASFWLDTRIFPGQATVPLAPRLALIIAALALILMSVKETGRAGQFLCRGLSATVFMLGIIDLQDRTPLVCLLVVFTGLSLLLAGDGRRGSIIAGQIVSMVIGLLTVSALVTYGFGLSLAWLDGPFSQIPVLYALSFGAAGFALFFVRPQGGPSSVFLVDDAGGTLARRFLMPLWLCVPLVGFVTGLSHRSRETLTVGILALNALMPCMLLILAHVLHRKDQERKAACEHVFSLNETLNRQFLELLQTNEQTRAAVRARAEFLSVLNHELRTPLAGVQGGLDLALTGPLSGDQRELLQMAYDSSQSLLHIIEDLLDFAAMQAREVTLLNTEFELQPLLESVVHLLESRAQAKGLTLSLNLSDDLPSALEGDRERLKQILTNLLDNAVKFSERGTVLLTVTRQAEIDGECLRFTVADSGVGIPLEKQKEIFEPFVQVDCSSTRPYGGAGLGLSIARCLVRLMGGELSVASTPGKGASFSFAVPFRTGCGMTFEQVIAAHSEWKATFMKAIMARTRLDAEAMARHDICNVGLWLSGEGKSRFSDLSSFERLCREHARFHEQAALVCSAVNHGKYDQACGMLAPQTPYAMSSQAFSLAFSAFRTEVETGSQRLPAQPFSLRRADGAAQLN
jgi:signal transduction histidine kinase